MIELKISSSHKEKEFNFACYFIKRDGSTITQSAYKWDLTAPQMFNII